MNVAVVGTTSLIGSAVCGRLADEGHHVRGIVRRTDAKSPVGAEIVVVDASEACQAEWMSALEGMEAVVNCVGALHDSATKDVTSVHVKGALALFAGRAASGVRRVGRLSMASA